MSVNELAISIGVVLFPGLLATIICDKIASHTPKWRVFKYSVYSFVFGVLCYACVQFASWAAQAVVNLIGCQSNTAPLLKVWSIATADKPNVDLREVAFASLTAPIVAAIAASINDWKLLNRIAQKLNLSVKFGDENLFSYYLNRRDIDWVYVRDPRTNQTYQGRVVQWSETDHIQEVVLSDVTVYEYESSKELYSLPTVYLARTTGTFVIEAIPPEIFVPTKELENGKETTQ